MARDEEPDWESGKITLKASNVDVHEIIVQITERNEL